VEAWSVGRHSIRQRADLPGGSRRLPLHPAGGQSYAYALFFMTDADLAHLKESGSWSHGVDPNIVVVNAGAAKDISALPARKGVYAFIFDRKGVMASVGIVGQKISRIR
jgi:lipid-binding SYLF domain-containing protein